MDSLSVSTDTLFAEMSSLGEVSFSSSLPPDSDEESCSQPALTLNLIFKPLVPKIFECSGSSADAEIVKGIWSNQEPLSLSPRFFFLSLTIWSFFFLLWAGFFRFLYPMTFSAFDFSTGVSVKSFHVGIFVKCVT